MTIRIAVERKFTIWFDTRDCIIRAQHSRFTAICTLLLQTFEFLSYRQKTVSCAAFSNYLSKHSTELFSVSLNLTGQIAVNRECCAQIMQFHESNQIVNLLSTAMPIVNSKLGMILWMFFWLHRILSVKYCPNFFASSRQWSRRYFANIFWPDDAYVILHHHKILDIGQEGSRDAHFFPLVFSMSGHTWGSAELKKKIPTWDVATGNIFKSISFSFGTENPADAATLRT